MLRLDVVAGGRAVVGPFEVILELGIYVQVRWGTHACLLIILGAQMSFNWLLLCFMWRIIKIINEMYQLPLVAVVKYLKKTVNTTR